MAEHPLDRPAWHALTSLQACHAVGNDAAVRFHPQIGPIAAARRHDGAGLAALAALVPDDGILATIEAQPHALPPGMGAEKIADLVQLTAPGPVAPYEHPLVVPLGPADAPEMLALATLTEPGPFALRTHELGPFWGIRIDGRLAAMAGERMHLPGFGEVSAVCVHPDFRGQGLAEIVTRRAMARVASAGLTPFLHAYADNDAALGLYRKLGFAVRHVMTVMMFRRAP
jgi:ribosomal protein S18 acetylase RimI-like enzyme